MLYLSGKLRPDLPIIVTPASLRPGYPHQQQIWAADTGCYTQPEKYNTATYLQMLHTIGAEVGAELCLFATAPDVVGDYRATLERSLGVLPYIRDIGFPAALVAQNGLESSGELNEDLWDEFDCLFIGGTDAWKFSEPVFQLVREANERGKWTHLGRVNSWRRFRMAAAAGYDSADGTYLRYDPMQKRLGKRRIETWSDEAIANRGLGL